MSLLRHCRLNFRVPPRQFAAAFLSTDAAPPPPAEQLNDGAEYFDAFSQPSATPTFDELPPAAPETAYPSANPVAASAKMDKSLSTRAEIYAVYVKSTRTNTITTLTRPNGNPVRTLTGGNLGFKGGNRSSYEAGYKCAVEIFKALEEEMKKTTEPKWQLYLNGFGQGREAIQKALMATEGQVVKPNLIRVTDKTPIKIGGTRAQKRKRR